MNAKWNNNKNIQTFVHFQDVFLIKSTQLVFEARKKNQLNNKVDVIIIMRTWAFAISRINRTKVACVELNRNKKKMFYLQSKSIFSWVHPQFKSIVILHFMTVITPFSSHSFNALNYKNMCSYVIYVLSLAMESTKLDSKD